MFLFIAKLGDDFSDWLAGDDSPQICCVMRAASRFPSWATHAILSRQIKSVLVIRC
jgi:hypothetical protein